MPVKTNKIKTTEYKRSLALRLDDSVNEDTRTLPAAISSEQVVKRWFGTEKLRHDEKSINLERAIDGLPLLFNHDPDKPIGRALNIRLEGGKLRADLKFSNNDFASQVLADVKDEMIRDVSLGYRIEKYKDLKGGIEATRWSPFEVSIATIPADHTVGINRSFQQETNIMADENTVETGVQGVNATHELGVNEGMRREQDRANGIRAAFQKFDGNEKAVALMNRCLTDHTISIETARAELLTLLSEGFEPTGKPSERTIVTGEDDFDKFSAAARDAIAVRAGIETDEKVIQAAREGDLMSFNLASLAREFMVRMGQTVRGRDAMSIVGESFRIAGAHSSSDFPSILADVANKSMAKGYTLAPHTWREWASVGSVSDFKKSNMITLSEFSDLELKPEGAEYKHGTAKDKREQIGVDTYGKMFSITREAIINDDLAALSRIPSAMGQAGARAVNALAYQVLTANPVLLEDSKTVFHADHNNIGTAGVISETTLDQLRRLMSSQSGLLKSKGMTKSKASTQILDIPGKYLIVPKALELAANKMMVKDYATDDRSNPNLMKGAFQVIASAYLDAVSATAYYLLADQNQYDTVTVAFLNGNQSPYLESKNGWNVDGVEYKVRIDVGAAWGDFRAAAYNAGA